MQHGVERVEVARAESDLGELVLCERYDGEGPTVLELRANGVFVMDTRETSTERALATAALGLCDDPADVLIGGLGLGYTMHEVLSDDRVRRCTVVEIEPALVGWMRDGTVPHGPQVLADARIDLVVADVAVALAETHEASYDLVLLDVDNGPGHLVHGHNAEIYRPAFLAGAARALRAGGVLVVWSANRAPELLEALGEAVGEAEERAYAVDLAGRDEHYHLYLAHR